MARPTSLAVFFRNLSNSEAFTIRSPTKAPYKLTPQEISWGLQPGYYRITKGDEFIVSFQWEGTHDVHVDLTLRSSNPATLTISNPPDPPVAKSIPGIYLVVTPAGENIITLDFVGLLDVDVQVGSVRVH